MVSKYLLEGQRRKAYCIGERCAEIRNADIVIDERSDYLAEDS
jgi:hypothetical protein